MSNRMSAQDYVQNGDIMGAYMRFQNTTTRYKDYWWEVIEKIFDTNKKEYIYRFYLDKANRQVTKMRLTGTRADEYVHYTDKTANANGCGVYFILHKSCLQNLWYKVGMTTQLRQRMRDLITKDYKKAEIDYALVEWFIPCASNMQAEAVEKYCQEYLIHHGGYGYIKNDRFTELESVSLELWEKMLKGALEIHKIFERDMHYND